VITVYARFMVEGNYSLCTVNDCIRLVAHILIVHFSFLCNVANCFTYIHSNIFILVSEYVCLLYKCVYLSNTSRKSHLFLEPNHSKVCGEISTCLPLVNISIPLLLFRGLKGPEGSPLDTARYTCAVQICCYITNHKCIQ
jgi:hypothetical protein